MADLLDPLTALADDGTGQLREKQTGSVKEAPGGHGGRGGARWLTSFGMVTCVVMTGPPMSLYEPLLPAEQCGEGGGVLINRPLTVLCQKNKRSLQVRKQHRGTIRIHPHSPD